MPTLHYGICMVEVTVATGKNIEYILENHNLSILNDIDSPTYIDNFTGKTSCLDLCSASHTLSNNANYTRGKDVGSDHFPIEISVGVIINKNDMQCNARWKLKKADWKSWKRELSNCDNYDYILPLDSDTHNRYLTEKILIAAENHIPKSNGKKQIKRYTPWWDDECKRAVQKRNTAKNLLLHHPTRQNLLNFKKLQATVKNITRKKK